MSAQENGTRARIDRFINHPVTDIVVMIMIVASIIMLVAELAVETRQTAVLIRFINEMVIALFIVELGLRYLAETKKKRFFRNYWIDILAVIPYLRMLRVLRVFRLMRVFKFGIHLSRRMGWLNASFQREAVQWFAVIAVIFMVVLFGAIGLSSTTDDMGSFSDMLWWSVMSLVAGEPIGAVPDSALGKLVALTVMCAGLTVFAMLTGVVSAVMIHRLGAMGTRDMDIDELNEHIVICGWNQAGYFVLHELHDDPIMGHKPIILIAEFEEPPVFPPDVDPDMIYVITGDFTRLDVLQKANLATASHAIVLADRTRERSDQDRDARSVLTAMLIERVNREIFTTIELLNRDNESLLATVGVDEIIVGSEYAANLITTGARNKGVVKVLEELLTNKWGNQLYKIEAQDEDDGKTWNELATIMKTRYQATLIGIETVDGLERKNELNPPPDRVVHAHELLLIIARVRPER